MRWRHLVLPHCQPQPQHQLLRQDPRARAGQGGGVVSNAPLPPPVGRELATAVHGVAAVLAELDGRHEVDGGRAGEPEGLQREGRVSWSWGRVMDCCCHWRED